VCARLEILVAGIIILVVGLQMTPAALEVIDSMK